MMCGSSSSYSGCNTGATKRQKVAWELQLDMMKREWHRMARTFVKLIKRGQLPHTADIEDLYYGLEAKTAELSKFMGVDGASLAQQLIAESNRWWVQELPGLLFTATTQGPRKQRNTAFDVLDALQASASAALNKTVSLFRTSTADTWTINPVLVWLSLTHKMVQVALGIHSGVLTEQPQQVKPAREKKSRAVKVKPERLTLRKDCQLPRPRPSKGDSRVDSIFEFIKRSGGINSKDPVIPELVHAAGDRRHVPPGLISHKGHPWSWIALLMAQHDYVPQDEYGREDEGSAREFLVNAIRGGYKYSLHPCAIERQNLELLKEQKRLEDERAEEEYLEYIRAQADPQGLEEIPF